MIKNEDESKGNTRTLHLLECHLELLLVSLMICDFTESLHGIYGSLSAAKKMGTGEDLPITEGKLDR